MAIFKRGLFISYYKNVLSSDFTTDAGDFDVSEKEAASWSKTTGKTVVANSAKEKTVTEITDDDDSRVKKIADGSITLKASSSSSEGTDKVITTTTDSNFAVQEAKIGRYAMVSKNSTLKETWYFPKDSYLKSAVPVDGSNPIVWENEIDNVR
ncbi:hypothetical protein SAMN02745152_00009 [Treponema berlinense]|uniref:Uncharacterized protein n=1 Tax=Treponema berlinense TaxID=225004 RepID=A0A1T4K8B9_9SPIR|nr:hypothetical protein [Treponema berlinense]SJZ38690.1 hypothetical protein SAMN02745152_00009 [Treponema berlinense]